MAGTDYKECNCGWLPIDSAPKRGDEEVLLWGRGYRLNDTRPLVNACHIGWFDGEVWVTRAPDLLCRATHWQPLPTRPLG